MSQDDNLSNVEIGIPDSEQIEADAKNSRNPSMHKTTS